MLNVEGIRKLLESYDRSVLTIAEVMVDVSLPEDLEFLEQLSTRSKQISLNIQNDGDIITEF